MDHLQRAMTAAAALQRTADAADVERITTTDRGPEDAEQSEIARLRARVADLEQGFRVYAYHAPDCELVSGTKCTCGLTDLVEKR